MIVLLIISVVASYSGFYLRNCDNNLFWGNLSFLNSLVYFINLFLINFSANLVAMVLFWKPSKAQQVKLNNGSELNKLNIDQSQNLLEFLRTSNSEITI